MVVTGSTGAGSGLTDLATWGRGPGVTAARRLQ